MSGFNYSKWDHIELSDDESDLHPNIDKDSWFRMKHRRRLETEASEDEELKVIENLDKDDIARLNVIRMKLARIKSGSKSGGDGDGEDEDDMEALEGEAKSIESELAKRKARVDDINERRKWNPENICKVKEEKTIVNSHNAKSLKADDFKPTGETEKRFTDSSLTKAASTATATATATAAPTSASASASASVAAPAKAPAKKAAAPVGPSEVATSPEVASRENFSILSYNDFVILHEDLLEKYSVIESMEATKKCIFQNCDILLHEHSQNYMLLSSLEDEMNGKTKRMRLVSRQSQILSHLQELGQSMGRDPRDIILVFFQRLDESAHFAAFQEQVDEFIKRIQKRAVEKRIEN